MKAIIKKALTLTLLFSGGAFATETDTNTNGQPSQFQILRSAHASGGTLQGASFTLAASIGLHSNQTSSGGNWQLIAGLITPQRSWPSDLIYTATFEIETPIKTAGAYHE